MIDRPRGIGYFVLIAFVLPGLFSAGDAAEVTAQHRSDHTGSAVDAFAESISDGSATARVAPVQITPAKSSERRAEFGQAVVTDGSQLFVGEPSSRSGRGNVHHYVRSTVDGAWSLDSSWVPPDYTEGRRYGHAVALDGDQLAVGAPATAGTGAVYLYRATASGSWELHSTLTIDEEIGDRFGSAVALSGNRVVVGAPGVNQSAGAVYVFTVSAQPGVWDVYGPISGPTIPQSGFGDTIAFDGSVVAVGSVFEDMHNGAVYILQPDGDGWSIAQRISKPRGDIPLGLGAALEVAGDSLFIGANVYETFGTVYLYARSGAGAEWQELQRIGQGVFNENYGRALAFEDPWLVVGGVGFDDFSGRISLHRRNASGWSLSDTFASSEADVLYGRYVDVSGGIVASTSFRGAHGDGSVAVLSIDTDSGELREEIVLESPIEGFEAVTGARHECSDGKAAGFQCRSVDLMSFLPIEDIGGPGRVNDVWGWTDAASGREFALVGRNDGTAFVEITSPTDPRYLGLLPTHVEDGATRDIKVYENHAFIVADAAGDHGMQVFDLSHLLTASDQSFSAALRYDKVASVHNIAINEQTGRAFLVGDRSTSGCSGGLHIVDIRDPAAPVFEACVRDTQTGTGSGGGYTHDVQCIVYDGPDARFSGREICVGSNTTHVSVFDVTRDSQPSVLSRGTYPDAGYIHQGWFTEDRRYFYQNDEADEFAQGRRTRTLIWDMQDLTDPVVAAEYEATTFTTDHNLYIIGDVMVQANYGSGLRILDISDPESPIETGFFDTAPSDYGGAWTAYPYFPSGNIVVSSIAEGLFVLRSTGAATTAVDPEMIVPEKLDLLSAYPNPTAGVTSVELALEQAGNVRIRLFDALGRQTATVNRTFGAGRHAVQVDLGGTANGVYFIVAESSGRTDVLPIFLGR